MHGIRDRYEPDAITVLFLTGLLLGCAKHDEHIHPPDNDGSNTGFDGHGGGHVVDIN